MARTRKSVLGENPFAAGNDSPSRKATADGDKPRKRTSKKGKSPSAARAKKAEADEPARGKPTRGKPARGKPARGKPKQASSSVQAADSGRSTSPSAKKQTDAVGPNAGSAQARGDEAAPGDRAATGHEQRSARQAEKRRIAQEIRSLENHVDEISRRAAIEGSERDSRSNEATTPSGFGHPGTDDRGMFETGRELLSSDYYLRQWGRLGMRNRSAEVDDFGHDMKYDARIQPLLDLLYERYFRVETEGIENVPAEGRALIVANHAGTFPYDGVMLKTAIRREHPQARGVRWLTEDHLFYMPFVGSFLNRMGAVRACQENAERLLQHERLVAVFPEGAKGTGRLYRNRHKLQRFGRGGFVRLCLRTQTPIIPCVILGAEESMPLLFRIEYLANLLGIPYIPITPTFPLLGPLGILPAPTKWQFIFGEPVHFERYGPEAADDHVLVRRLTERVRASMQGMIETATASRRSPWFG